MRKNVIIAALERKRALAGSELESLKLKIATYDEQLREFRALVAKRPPRAKPRATDEASAVQAESDS